MRGKSTNATLFFLIEKQSKSLLLMLVKYEKEEMKKRVKACDQN